jgi:hypothetical protein
MVVLVVAVAVVRCEDAAEDDMLGAKDSGDKTGTGNSGGLGGGNNNKPFNIQGVSGGGARRRAAHGIYFNGK